MSEELNDLFLSYDNAVFRLNDAKKANFTGHLKNAYDEVDSTKQRIFDLFNTRASEWARVEATLPKDEGIYLAYHKDWPLEIVSFYQGFFRSIGLDGDYPTHWKPITPPQLE